MKMNLNSGFDQEKLSIFQYIPQGDDRDFCADFAQAQEGNWPELSLQSPETELVDYENLPDLNPVTSMVRAMVAKTVKEVEDKGIPVIILYTGFKASLIAGAAYAAADGGIEEKNHAANMAVKALLVASPSIYVAGVLAVAKTLKYTINFGKKAMKLIASPKP